jgi:hypothetical protein
MFDPKAVASGRRLMELREARDRLKKEADTAEKEYREAEADFYEMLEEAGVTSTQKIPLGEPWGTVGFLPRTTYFGRVVDQDKALDYYEGRMMIDEVSAPKFVMKRINDEVRDCLEQGKDLPPGVDYYSRRGVTITRQKT